MPPSSFNKKKEASEQDEKDGDEEEEEQKSFSDIVNKKKTARIGDAWENGPSVDLDHVDFMNKEFVRREEAVEKLRIRMKLKSLPGYELRQKQKMTLLLLSQKFSRKYCRCCPCIVPTIAETVWDGDIIGTAACIGARASPDSRDEKGQLILSIAIQQRYDQLAKYLLDRGAKVNLTDQETNMCALHHAIIMGNKSLIRKILELKGDVSISDNDGMTPLLWASQRGYLEVVAMLIDQGANADHQDHEGWTALHIACYKGYMEVVEYLVKEAKVKVDIVDKNGFNARLYAQIEEKEEIVTYLDLHESKIRKKIKKKRNLNLPQTSPKK